MIAERKILNVRKKERDGEVGGRRERRNAHRKCL